MAWREVLKRVPGMVPMVTGARRAGSRLSRALGHGSYWWQKAPDGWPVPSPELLFRVSGAADGKWFLLGGRWAHESILEALSKAAVVLPSQPRVLDFGCGCGRVARHWLAAGSVDLVGTDPDRAAIRWCRRNLAGGHFLVNEPEPPLPLPTGQLDLVYALSVFTHLPQELQRIWLAELGRVLAPGGLLLLSLHGEAYLEELGPEEREEFQAGRLVVVGSEAAGSNDCNAFHPPLAVRALTRGWDQLVRVVEGARGNPKQDLVLLRKVDAESLDTAGGHR